MRIHVTQEDIDKGERGVASECAIARALKRQIPFAVDVAVLPTSININETSYLMPKKAITFVKRFDSYLSVKPFSFDLPVELSNAYLVKTRNDVGTQAVEPMCSV